MPSLINRRVVCLRLLGLLLVLCSGLALAQSGGNFEIKKSTIDGGGGLSTGGIFSLNGTVGQVEAVDKVTGGVFSLTGGFWAQASVNNDIIFKNSFEQ